MFINFYIVNLICEITIFHKIYKITYVFNYKNLPIFAAIEVFYILCLITETLINTIKTRRNSILFIKYILKIKD